MQPGLHKRKAQQLSKTKRFCKGKNDAQDSIPASWNLNELQRNFIESMFDDEHAKIANDVTISKETLPEVIIKTDSFTLRQDHWSGLCDTQF